MAVGSSGASGPCTIDSSLRRGMKSSEVMCLERRLQELGLQDSYIDGEFGTITENAVVVYQRSRRLYRDGVVGPQTAGSMGIWHANPWCNQAAQRISSRHDGAKQILIVRGGSWSSQQAVVQLSRRVAGRWTCSAELSGMVGRNGLRPLRDRRSGDGTTPAGVFPLARLKAWDGHVFSFFGNASNPGVPQGLWRQVRAGDCYGATPNTSSYGHLRYRSRNACGSPDEYLADYENAYTQAAIIGANSEPNVSGDAPGEIPYASAIFLHRHSYSSNGAAKPSAGCVSLASGELRYVLGRVNTSVLFAIGTSMHLYHDA